MTMNSYSEAHPRAVASIQALLSRHHPGSSPYRIAERALDLAFNSSCARGASPEQALLLEAENLIGRQVRAKLIDSLSPSPAPFSHPSRRTPRRTRHMTWHRTMRPRVAEWCVKAEIRVTTEERGGDGHALIR